MIRLIKLFFSSLFLKKYNSFNFPVTKDQYSDMMRKNIFILTSFLLGISLYFYGFKTFFNLESDLVDEAFFDYFMISFVAFLFIAAIIHSLFRIFLYKEFSKDKSLKEAEKEYPEKMLRFYKVETLIFVISLITLMVIGVR